eukprot:4290204-Pyramimonas_sp.AAC.1
MMRASSALLLHLLHILFIIFLRVVFSHGATRPGKGRGRYPPNDRANLRGVLSCPRQSRPGCACS